MLKAAHTTLFKKKHHLVQLNKHQVKPPTVSSGVYVFYTLSFLIPKIIRKIPLKIFGLLNITTFIRYLHQCLLQEIPSIITQTASMPTKNFGGQKQLVSNPTAKTIAISPRLLLLHFRLIFIPPLLHNNQNHKKCYKNKKTVCFFVKQTVNFMKFYFALQRVFTSSKVSVTSDSGFFVIKLTITITKTPMINAGKSS